jgi:hypothetical protein
MIKKDQLLSQVNKAIECEEKLIPLFSRHIPASVSFSELKPIEQKQVVDYFHKRAITQTKHIEMLKSIRDSIIAGSQDVF